jgi:hypothetical protein
LSTPQIKVVVTLEVDLAEAYRNRLIWTDCNGQDTDRFDITGDSQGNMIKADILEWYVATVDSLQEYYVGHYYPKCITYDVSGTVSSPNFR